MNQRSFATCALIVTSLCGLAGCATSRTQQFGMSFLPAAPKTAEPAPEPAAMARESKPELYANATPRDLERLTAPLVRPVVYESNLQKAEEHFASGKRLYQQGDGPAARREFDTAIELMMSEVEKSQDRARVEKRLEEMVGSIYRFDIEGLGSGEIAQQRPFDKAPLEEILDYTFPVDPTLKLKVKEEVAATSSQLPLTVNDTVLGFIHYFSSERGKKTLLAGLRRSGRYRQMISRILAEENVPQELIYLAQAESGFLPRAVSRAAAVGMWQFVQYRGRQYGLMQTPYGDDRLDPEKATRAAARHLKDLYTEFGNWHLAIAAYNCGPGCVGKAVERTGYADYWELRERNALPRETTNYVPIILAMTIIAKNASDYGIEGYELDPALEYDTLQMETATNLALVADLADVSVTEMHDLNPALSANVAPAGYAVHVPKGTSATVLAGLNSVPSNKRLAWRMHRVGPGESMGVLAKQFRVPADTLTALNAATETNRFVLVPVNTRELQTPSRLKATSRSARGKKASPAVKYQTAYRSLPRVKAKTLSAHRVNASGARRRGHSAVGASS